MEASAARIEAVDSEFTNTSRGLDLTQGLWLFFGGESENPWNRIGERFDWGFVGVRPMLVVGGIAMETVLA